MKKILLLFITVLTVAFSLCACGDDDGPKYYTVSFDSNGSSPLQSRAIAEGALIVEPKVPVRMGYTFLGWFADGTRWDFDNDTVTKDITLKAEWSRIHHTVTFETGGGSTIEEQVIGEGDFVKLPTPPTKKNHRFIGWYFENELWDFAYDRVNSSMTLKAKWESCTTYLVTFDSDGGSEISSQYIPEGDSVILPDQPNRSGAKFVGWYYNTLPWDFDNNTVTKEITLVALWEIAETNAVQFNSNGASSVNTQYVPVGEAAIQPPKPTHPSKNAEFQGWYLGDALWNFNVPVPSDMTLVAKWVFYYKVSFDTAGAGRLPDITVAEGSTVPPQDKLTLPEMIFDGWYYNGNKWNMNTDVVTSDMTLVAKWVPIPTYTVTFESNSNDEIPSQDIAEGKYVFEPQPPMREGYRFDAWYYGDKKWDFNSDKVTENITLSAKWIQQLTITFVAKSDSVKVAEKKLITVDEGTILTEEMIPKFKIQRGYMIIGWNDIKGNPVDFSGTTRATATTLTAVWTPAYTIEFNTNWDGIEIEPIQIAKNAQDLRIPEPEFEGPGSPWELDGWYLGGSFWDFERYTVTKDIVLTAEWCYVTPPIIIP